VSATTERRHRWADRQASAGPLSGNIPERIHRALVEHIERGRPCGHFVTAVLDNDLREAIGRADDENIVALPLIVSWLYNRAPGQCWGSPEKRQAWQAAGGLCGEGS